MDPIKGIHLHALSHFLLAQLRSLSKKQKSAPSSFSLLHSFSLHTPALPRPSLPPPLFSRSHTHLLLPWSTSATEVKLKCNCCLQPSLCVHSSFVLPVHTERPTLPLPARLNSITVASADSAEGTDADRHGRQPKPSTLWLGSGAQQQ